jgi:hypothetical protein
MRANGFPTPGDAAYRGHAREPPPTGGHVGGTVAEAFGRHTAEPGSPSEGAMRLLPVIGTQRIGVPG